MWRCGHGVSFFCSRGKDVEHDAIVDVDITSNSVFDVRCGDPEIVVQLGIDQSRIGIVKRELGETLGAIHGRLPPAYGVVTKRVTQFLHFIISWAFAGDAFDLVEDLTANFIREIGRASCRERVWMWVVWVSVREET